MANEPMVTNYCGICEAAAKIAAGLSEAQKRWLKRMPVGVRWADMRTAASLKRKGLIEPGHFIHNESMPAWPIPAFDTTETGQQVRAYLEDSK